MFTFVVCIGYLVFSGLVVLAACKFIAWGEKTPKEKQ